MTDWWPEMLLTGFDAVLIGFFVGTAWPLLSVLLALGGLVAFGIGGGTGLVLWLSKGGK